MLGTAMTPVALAFTVLQSTTDSNYLGYVLAAQMIPMVVFLVVGGGLADRFRRDRILQIANISACTTAVFIGANAFFGGPVWLFLPLAALNGISEAAGLPAMRGIIPDLVQVEALHRANSMLSTVKNAIKVLGPTIGGILAAGSVTGGAMMVSAVLFAAAATIMGFVSVPTKHRTPGPSFVRELQAGWSYFRAHRWIWSVSLALAIVNAIYIGAWQILGATQALQTIGPGAWGLILSCNAAGLLISSSVMLKWKPRSRPLVFALGGAILQGVPVLSLALFGSFPVVLAAASFTAGAGAALFGVLWDTALQSSIPLSMISRVSAYDDFAAYVAIPLGQLSAAPLASLLGIGPALTWGAVLLVTAAALPLAQRTVRAKEIVAAK